MEEGKKPVAELAREITETEFHLSGKKKKSMKASSWKWFGRRSAIEPIFGHLKTDHRLERIPLKGKDGDRMNAILACCVFNLRNLLRAFFLPFFQWLFEDYFQRATRFIGKCMSEDNFPIIPDHAF
jgi:IS5 family transposase